jgi:hypothetical protein
MRRTLASVSILSLFALAWAGCESRTDQTDSGGVLLSVTDFDELPVSIGVLNGPVPIGEVTIENVPVNPDGITSDLMNVELYSYEVVYFRGDGGTRVPPPLVRGIFGVAPVGGNLTIDGLPIMGLEQLSNDPLAEIGATGRDSETDAEVIILNCRLRFFGRTLSGDEVESAPAQFSIEVVQLLLEETA